MNTKVEVIPDRRHSVPAGQWEVLALAYQAESDTPWYVLDVMRSKPAVIRGEYVRAVTNS